jgi:hypothetical protein
MSKPDKRDEHWVQRRDDWIERTQHLVNDIVEWSESQDWEVNIDTKTIHEELLGEYEVPVASVHVPGGQLQVQPVALHVIGADGRVDLEAYPTLNRVKLVGHEDGWQIYTDSNIPLHAEWKQETFIQLAQELLA